MKFTISCLLTYRCYILNLVCPVVLEKKMLVNVRRTLDDDRHQPIAIGRLSYSGDLIKLNKFTK